MEDKNLDHLATIINKANLIMVVISIIGWLILVALNELLSAFIYIVFIYTALTIPKLYAGYATKEFIVKLIKQKEDKHGH